MIVKHKFVSAKTDGTDPSLINPSNWNDIHDVQGLIYSQPSNYNFTAQAPGVNLVGGTSNSLTLTPVPLGVNGTDSGHYLYISGGSGTPEAVLITGGTALSGAASGTIFFTPVSNHSGSWTIQSASSGLQEAISACPASGGTIIIDTNITLYANVNDSGKTSIVVLRPAGIVVSGAFKILGAAYSQFTKYQVFHNSPNFATVNTLVNGTQFDLGGFPDGRQFNFTTGPAVQALVGSINVETGALNTSFNNGIAGYARTTQQSQDVVGVFGSGVCAGRFTQAWGANIVVSHDAGDVSGSNLVGIEIDTNHSASGAQAAAIILGLSVFSNHLTPLAGHSYGIQVARLQGNQFTAAINLADGASQLGLSIGANHETNNNVNSQIVQFVSRSTTGTVYVTQMYIDPNNTFWIRGSAAGLGIIAIDPGGVGSSSFNFRPDFNQSNKPFRTLPISVLALPAGPLEGMMQAVTDCPVNTWGAPYVGGTGSNHVLLYFNGTAWTVVGK